MDLLIWVLTMGVFIIGGITCELLYMILKELKKINKYNKHSN